MTHQRWAMRYASYVLLLLCALVFLWPFLWLISATLKPSAEIFTWPPRLLPQAPTLENLRNLWEQTNAVQALWNSLLITVGNCALGLFVCSLGGYAFAKYRHAPGNRSLFALVLGTMMIPTAVTLIPVYIVLMQLGWINTYRAMIIPGAASAFGIFWMRQSMRAHLPDELLDAARLDGCGEFGTYWRIALPLARPALAALAILFVIGSWNNFMWAFIVLQTDDMQTLPLLIYLLQDEVQTPQGLIMAASLLATLPLLIAFVIFQRHFIEGLAAGALKA